MSRDWSQWKLIPLLVLACWSGLVKVQIAPHCSLNNIFVQNFVKPPLVLLGIAFDERHHFTPAIWSAPQLSTGQKTNRNDSLVPHFYWKQRLPGNQKVRLYSTEFKSLVIHAHPLLELLENADLPPIPEISLAPIVSPFCLMLEAALFFLLLPEICLRARTHMCFELYYRLAYADCMFAKVFIKQRIHTSLKKWYQFLFKKTVPFFVQEK